MTFLITAYDYQDETAYERRMEVREKHLNFFKEMVENRVFKYGVGIKNDEGRLIGSMIVCEFDSKEDIESKWLKNEPYVLNNVWETIEIKPCAVPPFLEK